MIRGIVDVFFQAGSAKRNAEFSTTKSLQPNVDSPVLIGRLHMRSILSMHAVLKEGVSPKEEGLNLYRF